jgi:hypothetical protein
MLAKSSEKLSAIDPVRLRSIIPLRQPSKSFDTEQEAIDFRERYGTHIRIEYSETKKKWFVIGSCAQAPSAEEVTGLSEDTLKRRFPHLIRQLSDRRRGMQLGDAITIANGK